MCLNFKVFHLFRYEILGSGYEIKLIGKCPKYFAMDLLHLVKRSHNTIIKVSIPSVIDNSHVVSMIVRKMCPSDRKIWPRGLEKDGKLATYLAD